MNKKNILIILSIIALITIIVCISILISGKNNKEEVSKYSNVVVDGYQVKINDKYNFEYDKETREGHLKNKLFSYSYLYVTDKKYGELITSSSYYTNMGAKELDTSIEEMKFGEYEGFINEKKVYYDDVDKEYHMVIILIKVSTRKTFVVQYEVSYEVNYEEILKDIKEGLTSIKKVN